ncbi:VTT domain-containing protein [Nocardioides sp. CN2-186]|uniref:bifunctional DedA family/phosphatase PAP2 family protein n=1 Tax=Nocardioides tweenelious TaxID=3156607 RepID=UPI0032B426C5
MTGAIDSLLTSLGPLSVLIVMAIVFAETGLLAGFFLPGDSLLFTAGLLVAHGVIGMPIGLVIVAAAAAAFAGDQLGYLIGRRLGPRLMSRPQSRLLDPAHLERASSFFDRHGPRAVILARFVPVARTFTPPAAGAGRMPYRQFVIYNAIGAVAWCTSMLGAGYLFGGIPFVNAHIELITLVIVVLSLIPAGVAVLRSRLRTNPRLALWLVGAGVVACALATVALADAALERDGVAAHDASISDTVVVHRSDTLTPLARAASWAGGEVSVALLSVAVIVTLLIARRRREAVVVGVAMAGAAVLVVGIKHLVMRARPGPADLLGPVDHGYSFPSGHTLFSAVFLAMVVWLVLPHLARHWRPFVVGTALVLAAAVGASRVYLGYHWPTDVLASWLIATGWLGLLYVALHVVDRGDTRPESLPGCWQARHENVAS